MVFSLNNIAVSIVMEYQSDTLLTFTNAGNKLIMLLAIAIVILHFVFFFVRVHEYTDSLVFYHRHKSHTHYFPMGFVVRNVLLMTAILLEQELGEISTHFCLGIQTVYMVAVIVARPYRKNIDYVRFGAVEATLSVSIVSRFI